MGNLEGDRLEHMKLRRSTDPKPPRYRDVIDSEVVAIVCCMVSVLVFTAMFL